MDEKIKLRRCTVHNRITDIHGIWLEASNSFLVMMKRNIMNNDVIEIEDSLCPECEDKQLKLYPDK